MSCRLRCQFLGSKSPVRFLANTNLNLMVKMVDDSRPVAQRMVESFLNKFFPSGYPYSVNEGYLRYTQFRALQHFTSAALSVLSTQSLLFAAGLRPTPAQATAVSWILKDGMQHVGKLICSNLGARMDSEPKRWRILGLHDVHGALCYAVILLISLKELLLHELILLLAFLCHIIKILIILAFYAAADVLYDLGTGLEVMSPLCPHLFLEVAGLGNFAKGMAVVAARATRLPIYSSFAKEGNLSDLFAKGEAISTLFNVLGLGAGIHLASNICSSMQGKLVVAPLLSIIHVYSVCEEMRATPVNTLNPQRTAMIVAEFVKTGKISSPADLRYQEDLVFPERLIEDAGNVKVGRSLHEVVSPSKLRQFKETFHEEKFLLNRGSRWTDMILEHDATGEDALRGWMVAAYASDMERLAREPSTNISQEAYEKMNSVFSPFLAELQAKGWHTDRFLDGTGSRFVF
ncbi:protein root UVB sensitive 2, chloroplastic isoform X2 [Nicotiana sylvestris]|uniref:protein root UVB sensitive 2, chloroplastic isoform X2 n=1 Tax=Nicotiana sylvestris TaxID=4096 RepID=UPI00388CEA2D